jgi:apolipoprotein D and lipocalin family protein
MRRELGGMMLVTALLALGCTGVPKGLNPVTGFEVQHYMGKWYEIARLDHRFERGLSDVSASYAQQDDDTISVLNRGFSKADGAWKEVRGTARFRGDRTVGSLKVTFFWPFYGGYHIIALDKDQYSYAMVAGPSRSYLWILSRRKDMDKATLDGLVRQAAELGFATDGLIYVPQYHPEG